MNKQYNLIKSALSICPAAFEASEEFYKKRFEEFIVKYDQDFIDRLREEIREALNDSNWSWKEAAEEVDFYAFYPSISEEQLLKEIRFVMWDVLFVHRNSKPIA